MHNGGGPQAALTSAPLRGSVTGWAALFEFGALLVTNVVLNGISATLQTGDSELSWSPLIHLVFAVPGFVLSLMVIGIAEIVLRRSRRRTQGWAVIAIFLVVTAATAQTWSGAPFGAGATLSIASLAFGATLALFLAAPRRNGSGAILVSALAIAVCLFVWSIVDLAHLLSRYSA